MSSGPRRIALAALAVLCAVPPAGAQLVRPLGNERLDAVATRYFDEQWRLDPVRATRAGVHDYDGKLGSFSAEGYAERLAAAKRFLSEVKAIDAGTMGAEASDDARILEDAIAAQILALGTMETWKHEPASYTAQAAAAIFVLLSRDFAPLPERMRSVIARERQIPAMLEDAKANVTTVDATTALIARQNITGAIAFFSSVVPAALAPVKDAALQAQFKSSNDAAIAGVKSYLSALGTGPFARPSGTYAIGSAHFAEMLRLQESVPISLLKYERLGEAALAQTKADFLDTARRIDSGKPAAAVALALGNVHPAEGDLLGRASADLASLRTFVVAHRLITLPSDDDVKVVATPSFARATTFASMNAPGPLETKATEAFYNVTPVEPDWNAARKAQHLAFFNDYSFPLVTAHEVMPGHYVNFSLARHERISTIRRILASPSFAEGWAHYDEQMLVDEGWGNGDPHVRLAQLQGALLRECRLLVGLREHTQNMSVEAAMAFFEQNAFIEEEPARREALRGTADPLYGYYTLGKLELLKLRDDYKRIAGSRYRLAEFHDRLLSRGDPPIAIARKNVLGADDDGKLF